MAVWPTAHQPRKHAQSAIAAAVCLLTFGAPAHGYQAIDVVDPGTIAGTVRFQGDPPPPATVRVTTDREVCGDEKTSSTLLVGSDRGLANVVVRLADIEKGKALPAPADVTFDQKGCEYTPHVLLFPAGSTVRIQNDDGILHNTQVNAERNRGFNVAQPKYRRVVEKKISEPEMPIRVQCDVHRWMRAIWVAEEHPYYAVTDARGSFALADVPPGTYRLELWHETLGTRSQSVTVSPHERVDLTLEMAKR
jgi:hypothetical protein